MTGATRMRVTPADGLPVPGHPSVTDALVGISFDRCSTGTGQQQAIAPLALAITRPSALQHRACGKILRMDVLASRIILHPTDPTVSQRFYRDTLGLAVYREFGPPESPGMVFYAGQGLIEISGHSDQPGSSSTAIWLQVRDVTREHARLAAAGAAVLRGPHREFWGLIEMWIADPDGNRIVLVEIPADHPLRRDTRPPREESAQTASG